MHFIAKMAVGSMAAAFVTTGTASAQGWTERDFSLDGQAIVSAADADKGSVVQAVSAGGETTGVMFTCLNGELYAEIALEAYDFSERKQSNRVKGRDVNLYINDQLETTDKWAYQPMIGILRPTEHTPKAKLYNAAVRGDKVSIEARNIGRVDIDLPPIDDAFRAFARDCNMKG